MSISTKHAVVFLLLLVTVLASGTHASERNWDLETSLSKQSYVLHEPIWLDVTPTNITSDTLRTYGLDAPNHRQFTIVLTDRAGDSLAYTGPHYDFDGLPGRLVLEAAEQDAASFNLLDLFAPFDDSSGYRLSEWLFPFIPVGTYTVQVYFEDVVSQELSFDIFKASGEEEAVLRLIVEAGSTCAQEDRAVMAFSDIVERHPSSVFAEQCYYISRAYSQKSRDQRRQGTYDRIAFHREMLAKFSNSGRTKGWITAIAWKLEESEQMEFFNSVIEDKANTRAARYAKLLRDRLLRKQARERGE